MAVYVKYGSLAGEVTAKGYENWMEAGSFQWGVGRGISSGTGGGSKREATAPNVSEIVITKTMDAISPLILKEALGGKATEVKIHMTQTDGAGKQVAYQKYILTNTLISGYSLSSGGDRPSESLSLNFTKIDSEYIKINDKFETTTTGHVIYDIALSEQT
jgi:type VI secretion system secreted protein Hcp